MIYGHKEVSIGGGFSKSSILYIGKTKMKSREDFKSFIPAKRKIPELTVRAVIVGALLAIILGAANAYFGLYAGMTVSAAIPGAVMAFAFLRPFKGTILEVNVGMMGAAGGTALAAGVIFTIPALVILGTWTEIHYIETTIVALLGGMLGVLWMVPLRRAHLLSKQIYHSQREWLLLLC